MLLLLAESKFLQILDRLEQSVASPDFVRHFKQSRECSHTPEGADELDTLLGEYVVVTKEDAIAAMACYIAAWLSTVPEAQDMEPAQLQKAVLASIKV